MPSLCRAFQDITLRLIGARILDLSPTRVYLHGEVSRRAPRLPAPPGACNFHIYCSPYNEGAVQFARELSEHVRADGWRKLLYSESFEQLTQCVHMLLYLNGATWTSGEHSVRLAHEVVVAMREGVHLLLVHEMPGVGQAAARRPVEFKALFECKDGATPRHLLHVVRFHHSPT